jgi:S-(hydroxymethyl)mycothiol dehydrogenase
VPQQVQAVISRAKDAPVELVTITVPDPGPGEAVVKVMACGVCHTDLHYVKGGIGEDYPYLLGHEAPASSSRWARVFGISSRGTTSS